MSIFAFDRPIPAPPTALMAALTGLRDTPSPQSENAHLRTLGISLCYGHTRDGVQQTQFPLHAVTHFLGSTDDLFLRTNPSTLLSALSPQAWAHYAQSTALLSAATGFLNPIHLRVARVMTRSAALLNSLALDCPNLSTQDIAAYILPEGIIVAPDALYLIDAHNARHPQAAKGAYRHHSLSGLVRLSIFEQGNAHTTLAAQKALSDRAHLLFSSHT